MGGHDNIHHQPTPGTCCTITGADADGSTHSTEEELRRLDQELDQRINQVLKLAHPPRHVPCVRKTVKPSSIKSRRKTTTIPAHTHSTGGVISIHNGKVEELRQTSKSREGAGAFKMDTRSFEVVEALEKKKLQPMNKKAVDGLDVEAKASKGMEQQLTNLTEENRLNIEALRVKDQQLTNLHGGNGLDEHNEREDEIDLESDKHYDMTSRKQSHISRTQEPFADGQARNEERNAAENDKEKSEGGRGEETEDSNKEPIENEGDESEEEIDDQDAIFDEFLDAHTRGKIRLLTTKVTMMTQALQAAKDEAMSLSKQKREMSQALREGEAERQVLTKRMTAQQQDLAKLTRTNTQLNTRVKELTTECQTLRKEVSSMRQHAGEQRGTHNTLRAQLSRATAETVSLRDQLATQTLRFKEEGKGLRGQLEEVKKNWQKAEREQRNLSVLVAKQRRLIEVLEKQKSNIIAGKAVAALEERFSATVERLKPQ